MSQDILSRYSKKFHRTLLASADPRYNRIKARIAGEPTYFTGNPCKNGHVDRRNTSTGQCKSCLHDYYKKDIDRYLRKAKEWAEKNPEKRRNAVRRYDAKHRGEKKGRDAVYQTNELQILLKKQKNRCANCRKNIAKKYHADHITPLARGGSHDIKNIQLLCPKCNLRKAAKDPLDWARENGRLL